MKPYSERERNKKNAEANKMKNTLKKLIALVLVIVAVMSIASVSALAENESVTVSAANDEIYFGDKVVLVATVEGVEGAYSIVWEMNVGGSWEMVGSGSTYSFIADEFTASCQYRAVVVVEG